VAGDGAGDAEEYGVEGGVAVAGDGGGAGKRRGEGEGAAVRKPS